MLSVLVIEMRLPEKWECAVGKHEKDASHRGSHPSGTSGTLVESALSPIIWHTQHPFLVASELAYGA